MKKKECNNGTFDSEMHNLLQLFIYGIDSKEETLESMRMAYNNEISRVTLITRNIPLAFLPIWHDYKQEVKEKYESFRYTVETF